MSKHARAKLDRDSFTIEYYDRHGIEYFRSTVGLVVDALYAPFLKELPVAGHVLDAGCGSGRDSRAFLERGFRVTAIDASQTMVQLASEYLGKPVQQVRLEDLEFESAFDGIWACASLLHVQLTDLPHTFRRLARGLRPGGVMYVSFKIGKGTCIEKGRLFTSLSERDLADLVADAPTLNLKTTWRTQDVRGDGDAEWLNAIIFARSCGTADSVIAP